MRYFLLACFTLFLSYFGLLEFLRGGFLYMVSPIQFGLSTGAEEIKNTFVFVQNVQNIYEENLRLSRENQQLKTEKALVSLYQEENIHLKQQLAKRESSGFDRELLLARMMSNPSDLTGSTLFIDKGTRHGVTQGDNIILGENLLGIVTKTSINRSEIRLITSNKSYVSVYNISTEDRTEGVAVGILGTSVEMTRILPSEDIAIGDFILTSGKDGLHEPDLIVGTVTSVVQESAEPLKSALVEPQVDLGNINKVFVILRNR